MFLRSLFLASLIQQSFDRLIRNHHLDFNFDPNKQTNIFIVSKFIFYLSSLICFCYKAIYIYFFNFSFWKKLSYFSWSSIYLHRFQMLIYWIVYETVFDKSFEALTYYSWSRLMYSLVNVIGRLTWSRFKLPIYWRLLDKIHRVLLSFGYSYIKRLLL